MNIRKLNTLMILIDQTLWRLCFGFESFKYSQKIEEEERMSALVGGEHCVISYSLLLASITAGDFPSSHFLPVSFQRVLPTTTYSI